MKIGYLIPEFPGQTHAFFMRERAELSRRGVASAMYSTRPPANGAATHEWAAQAAAETTYLTPMSVKTLWSAVCQLMRCGPVSWLRCLLLVLAAKELSIKDRLRLLAMVPVAAAFSADVRNSGVDHVHIHSCANAAWIGVFANKLTGIPYSLTLHGPLHDYGPNQILKWRSAAFVIIITKELLRQARNTLPHDQLPELLLAPMGVDVDAFQRRRPYTPATRNSTVKLVSCGRINVCKGHDDLIRAVHLLRQQGINAELTICGASDGRQQDYLQLLKSLIEQFQLQDSVRLMGSVSEHVVRSELEAAHIFCLASHKEPLGVATMEAMAMQVPAIVTESEGVTEMIQTDVDGILVQPHSAEQFVARICNLIDAPEDARQLGKNGRQTIAARFHSGVSAETIIQGVLGKKQNIDEADSQQLTAIPLQRQDTVTELSK